MNVQLNSKGKLQALSMLEVEHLAFFFVNSRFSVAKERLVRTKPNITKQFFFFFKTASLKVPAPKVRRAHVSADKMTGRANASRE